MTYPELRAEIEMAERHLKAAKSPKMKKHYKSVLRRLRRERDKFEKTYYGRVRTD